MHRILTLAGALVGVTALLGAALSVAAPAEKRSGVDKGGMLSAFHPTHVSGPDKKTNTCPVCKYPSNPAIQVWMNNDDPKNVGALVEALEKMARTHADKRLKVFVVFLPTNGESPGTMEARLSKLASQKRIEHVALTYLPSLKDEAISDYEINTDAKVKNTLFVYKNRRVDTKFVNFVADAKGLEALNAALKRVL